MDYAKSLNLDTIRKFFKKVIMNFKDFNFKPQLLKAIKEAGFKEPSPVQKEAIPVILEGYDIVAQAHTGTGKTAAFALPILQMIETKNKIEAVVIVPTRELAMQVSDEIYKFGKYLGINTATVYGGSSYSRQLKHIKNASVIVATPGRFLDLLSSQKIDIAPSFVVLDEADEMLDMGFLDDIKEIFSYLPTNRQTMMFSATMPKEIKELALNILHEPKFISITKNRVTNENIKQNYYVVEEHERDDALIRLLDYKDPAKSIVFCRTKKEVDRLSTLLISQGYMAKGLHGDMEQRQREEVIKSFKKGDLEILIATDVAARGLDVNDVTHVFNYHIPFDSESYVHRIGRTGRAGKEGVAVTILTPKEFNSLNKIQKSIGSKIETKVIPTIKDVKSKKVNSLIGLISSKKVDDNAKEIVNTLLENGEDLLNIALKLASLLSQKEKIKGANKIGKSKEEINRLFDRYYDDLRRNKKSKRRGQKSQRGGYSRNRGGRGRRSRY